MFGILRALFLNQQFATGAFDLIRRIIIDKWLNKPPPVPEAVKEKIREENKIIQKESKIAQSATAGESEDQLITSLNEGKF